ncbi:MAG: GH116 family glycosyl hydrolase [Candidatus Latescibacterota bacterium]
MVKKLFPTDMPVSDWVEFMAEGFSEPVTGMIYRTEKPASCGMPLGGISTGCLDIETWSVLGFNTMFCPFPRLWIGSASPDTPDPWFASPFHPYPTSPRSYLPFLGLTVRGQTWVLASKQIRAGGYFDDRSDDITQRVAPSIVPEIKGVRCATEIHYWGHYPIADIEYDTDSPVGVGLRAWSPFIPGDAVISNTPAAVFEVHLRNVSEQPQQGRLVFSFPGPSEVEARFSAAAPRKSIRIFSDWQAWIPEASSPLTALRQTVREGPLNGITVASETGTGFFLGVIGNEHIRMGGGLDADDWRRIDTTLPDVQPTDFSASLSVDFDLAIQQEKVVRIVLSWYQPIWYGGDGEAYTQMYASRFRDATDVALLVASQHRSMLDRILRWQEVIYTDGELPPWLSDVLVNSLSTIPETSFWSMDKGKLEEAGPEGFFGQMESGRRCPAIGVIPCDFYGNLPMVYFFPELARNTLLAYSRAVRDDGAAPIALGFAGLGEGYEIHVAMNGVCFVDLVDRLWRRTGDEDLLRNCYPAMKRCTTFTVTRKPGPEGIISVAGAGQFQDWWEWYPFYGMTAHVGGLHLAMLQMAGRMAEKLGDMEFSRQCQAWFEQGSKAMEEHLWNGQYYLLYHDPESDRRSDTIMACQLDGEWVSRFHDLPGAFSPDHVEQTLRTVRQLCMDEIIGAFPFVTSDGNPTLHMTPLEHHSVIPYAIFPPETTILGMTYLYAGDMPTGLEIIRRNWHNMVCRHGHAWDLPNMVRPYSGRTAMGTEYYQNLSVWGVPAALARHGLAAPCQPGGLVDRIIKAGRAR